MDQSGRGTDRRSRHDASTPCLSVRCRSALVDQDEWRGCAVREYGVTNSGRRAESDDAEVVQLHPPGDGDRERLDFTTDSTRRRAAGTVVVA